MRRAGLVVGGCLALLQESADVGMTTADRDRIAADFIRGEGATPSFLGYHGYPATLCVSVNDEVVHGIPGERVIADGDLVSIDCGAIVDVRVEIVDGYTGHGIGEQMHMEPTVFNERVKPRGPAIGSGATVAIEPMITLGTFETHELDDGWTVLTDEGSRAAHWENTVALTDHGLWVLTSLNGGKSELEAAGLLFGPLD